MTYENKRRGWIKMDKRTVCLIILSLLMPSCLGAWSLIERERRYTQRGTPMHKVLLTQKGYIQFLRWELPVPEIKQFTFCLWIESSDLTEPHSIFSYSKQERDRLVRAWISSHGRSVHLEIGETEVFATATDIRENRWYHLCQSWENRDGRYGLWINGELWVQGQSEQLIGHVIPSGGDIVLGQEYTDFDKGLEEGIEGAVLGFNLLLASAFDPLVREYDAEEASHDSIPLPSASSYAMIPLFARIPPKVQQRGIDYGARPPYTVFPIFYHRLRRYAIDDESLDWFDRAETGHFFPSNRTRIGKGTLKTRTITGRAIDPLFDSMRIEISKVLHQPLGLQLVKLTYVRCEIGRGSPFIGGPLMLISWSRTPVRVFGGATLKNVKSNCGNF